MAITKYISENETITLYAGMVVEKGMVDLQIMSDVWEYTPYGIVYDVITDRHTLVYGKAEVDASPELIALYKKCVTRENRHMEACRKWGEHNRKIEMAHRTNLSLKEYKKLCRTYGGKVFDGCVELLCVKKFKSQFRASLANQLRDWLANPEPKYRLPFSRRQEECVMPYRSW